MPVELRLSQQFKSAGWKVKIRDKERLEPPHVSIIRKDETWRLSLRSREFLDKEPAPDDLPKELVNYILNGELSNQEPVWQWLCSEWDKLYPNNPIKSVED